MKELLDALATFHRVAERHNLIKQWVDQLHQAKPDKMGVNLSVNWGGSLPGFDLVRKALINEIEGSYIDITGTILAKSQAEFDAAKATVQCMLRQPATVPPLSPDLVAVIYGENRIMEGKITLSHFTGICNVLWKRAHGNPV